MGKFITLKLCHMEMEDDTGDLLNLLFLFSGYFEFWNKWKQALFWFTTGKGKFGFLWNV